MDEDKVIKASDLVKDPDEVYRFLNSHIIVSDSSLSGTYTNMIQAINMLAARGWDVVNFSQDSSNMSMHVLLKNTNWKSKNAES